MASEANEGRLGGKKGIPQLSVNFSHSADTAFQQHMTAENTHANSSSMNAGSEEALLAMAIEQDPHLNAQVQSISSCPCSASSSKQSITCRLKQPSELHCWRVSLVMQVESIAAEAQACDNIPPRSPALSRMMERSNERRRRRCERHNNGEFVPLPTRSASQPTETTDPSVEETRACWDGDSHSTAARDDEQCIDGGDEATPPTSTPEPPVPEEQCKQPKRRSMPMLLIVLGFLLLLLGITLGSAATLTLVLRFEAKHHLSVNDSVLRYTNKNYMHTGLQNMQCWMAPFIGQYCEAGAGSRATILRDNSFWRDVKLCLYSAFQKHHSSKMKRLNHLHVSLRSHADHACHVAASSARRMQHSVSTLLRAGYIQQCMDSKW